MFEWLSGLGSGIGNLAQQAVTGVSNWFTPSQLMPSANYNVYDPGGLSEFTAGTEPVYSPSVAPQYVNWAGPSGGEGSGFTDWLGKFASGAGKYLDPALKLTGAGMGIWSNVRNAQLGAEQMAVLRDQQKRLAATAAPAASAGGALTAAGAAGLTGGPLPAGLEARVSKFKDDAMMRYRQYLADTGQTDSSAALQMNAWVEREAAIYRQQLAEGLLQQGYGGITAALGPSQDVSKTATNLVSQSMGGAGNTQQALWRLLGQG